MNYECIHDYIIQRALIRERPADVLLESHHIVPRCEGGCIFGPQVWLTQKEHRIVHKLRHRINGALGNLLAYNLMRFGRQALQQNHTLYSREGGRAHHSTFKLRSPTEYRMRQQKAGRAAGTNSRNHRLGFHSLSEEQRKDARDRGRETTVREKRGMFSDDYRRLHAKRLHKPIMTPAGAFESMSAAADYFDISAGTVTYRVNNSSTTWASWHYMKQGV